MNKFEITPIFPTVLCTFFVNNDAQSYYEKLIETNSFKDTTFGTGSQVSLNYNVLDKFKVIKDQIENGFIEFKNNILGLETTNFKMTTSWVTKTPPNCGSQRHSHKNSYYSGVLYLTDHLDQSPILFFNPNDSKNSILTNPEKEYNNFNSKTWSVHPEKNKVILFPSHIDHMILKNFSNKDRYSVAFNFFPFGEFGSDDSRINLFL